MKNSARERLLQRVLKNARPDARTGAYRVVQVYIPGTEIMLAHVIGKSDLTTIQSLGLDIGCHLGELHQSEAVGIMRFTPYEAAVIGADIAVKAADVELQTLDRFSGTLLFTGKRYEVKMALQETVDYFDKVLHFGVCAVTER